MDGTVGAGGHAEAILQATAPDGRLLGCDRDQAALAVAGRRLAPFGERVLLRHADYRQLPDLLDQLGLDAVSGILLDLGVSSMQLDDPERGFSFRENGPLDMRMDRTQTATAAALVNSLPADRLASILQRFGEEPRARRIAGAIARARAAGPITTTRALAELVSETIPERRGARIHPATRVFQALRIAVNAELDGLDRLLEEAASRLLPGGRIAVIAFQSLEDRIVKSTLRGMTRRCLCPRDLPVCACGRPGLLRAVMSKAVRPGAAEIEGNPRSRSARLRAYERLESAT